jgi:hypothetical protein
MGWAYYVPWTPGTHAWYQYQFRVTGSLLGNQSNVDIRLYENEDVNPSPRYTYISPDSVQAATLYQVGPTDPTILQSSSAERVYFTATFDKPISRDPRCLADSPPA